MPLFTIGVSVIVISTLLLLLGAIQKRLILTKLTYCYRHSDIDEYRKLMSSRLLRFLFPRFNFLFLQLNGEIKAQNSEKVESIFDEMDRLKMSPEQRTAMYSIVLKYFIDYNEVCRAEKILEHIEHFNDIDLS